MNANEARQILLTEGQPKERTAIAAATLVREYDRLRAELAELRARVIELEVLAETMRDQRDENRASFEHARDEQARMAKLLVEARSRIAEQRAASHPVITEVTEPGDPFPAFRLDYTNSARPVTDEEE
jgi:chromosome segregation ATPase